MIDAQMQLHYRRDLRSLYADDDSVNLSTDHSFYLVLVHTAVSLSLSLYVSARLSMNSDVNKARPLKAKAKAKATFPRPSHNAKAWDKR